MHLFSRPYYFEEDMRKRWLTIIAVSVFIFLFLWGFQPFEINAYPGNIPRLVSGYALSTFGSMLLFYIIAPTFFPRLFHPETWTTGKELCYTLSLLLFIGFFNLLYSCQMGILQFSWRGLWYFQFYTFAVGVFPLVFLVFFNERRKFAQHEALSKTIMQDKAPISAPAAAPTLISLVATNGKVALELVPSAIIYLKSEANYIEIFYLEKAKLQKKLLRNTLRAMENQLQARMDIFRCHKSYIVNMQHITHISGNAQGLKIHLKEAETVIPVSRKHNQRLKEQLTLRP